MISVFDNFIKDEQLLEDISNDLTFFQNPGIYYWWDGWWSSPSNTIKKRLTEYIWGLNCPIKTSYSVSGFEYWTGVQSAPKVQDGFKDNLILHYDKDEALFEKTGEIVRPLIGCVYYPPGSDFDGGDLEIYTVEGESPEVLKTLPNRLIIFDAGYVLHRVNTVTRGTRRAIAINLWGEEIYSQKQGLFSIEP